MVLLVFLFDAHVSECKKKELMPSIWLYDLLYIFVPSKSCKGLFQHLFLKTYVRLICNIEKSIYGVVAVLVVRKMHQDAICVHMKLLFLCSLHWQPPDFLCCFMWPDLICFQNFSISWVVVIFLAEPFNIVQSLGS